MQPESHVSGPIENVKKSTESCLTTLNIASSKISYFMNYCEKSNANSSVKHVWELNMRSNMKSYAKSTMESNVIRHEISWEIEHEI